MVRDSLGNELKEGMSVMISYNNAATVARVVRLKEPSTLGPMPVAGEIVFQIILPVEFGGDEIGGVWALATPSNQDRAAQKEATRQ